MTSMLLLVEVYLFALQTCYLFIVWNCVAASESVHFYSVTYRLEVALFLCKGGKK